MKIKINDIQTLYRHDLCSFTQFAFSCINPATEYQDNWHIHLITDYLTQVARGKIKRLIINLPPRMLKSHCTSVAFIAWMLGRDPTKKILCLHASNILGKELEDDCLEVMQSPRYRSLFEQTRIIESGRRLETNFGGYRQYLPMEAKLTGIGADIIIVDDPMSTLDANDDLIRTQINTQFDQNVLQRLNNKKDGIIIVVMQRLHEDDLTGHLLKKSDEWVHLSLPAFAVKEEEWLLSGGNKYNREMYEALHPERESFEALLGIRKNIGGQAFCSQYLQLQLKPICRVIEVPQKYGSLDEWEKAEPSAVFREFFVRDHGAVVVPEALSAQEWETKYGEKARGTYRPQLESLQKESK